MNEIFDRLILRFFLAFFICFIIFIYKYAHLLLYPSVKTQMLKKIFPSRNNSETLHLFSRIIGFGIILSGFHFDTSDGLFLAIVDFFAQGMSGVIFYLASIYIIESTSLYNFSYEDEVMKRKNLSYAIVSSFQALGLASCMKTILKVSNHSLVLLFLLWLFTMVLIALTSKAYKFSSRLSFNRLILQKNLAIAFSYSGFFVGCCILINSSIMGHIGNFYDYMVQIVLKILLSLIIFPIFRYGIIFAFKIEDDYGKKDDGKNQVSPETPEVGYGIYEGILFLTSCFLTSIITGRINLGTIYPWF